MKEQIARLLAEQDGYEWEDLQTDYTDMYYRMAKEICELFKPKGEKPPVLTHKDIIGDVKYIPYDTNLLTKRDLDLLDIGCKRQWGADVAYYEVEGREMVVEQ